MYPAEHPKTPIHRSLSRFIIAQVTTVESDHESLAEILVDSSWELHHFRTYREARRWLISHRVAVVLSESSLPDGSWREILDLLMKRPNPPNLIVSSRLSDERLWAEVLNLGGYDLLATPFQVEEVLRVVSMACNSWERKAPQRSRLRERPAIHQNPNQPAEKIRAVLNARPSNSARRANSAGQG